MTDAKQACWGLDQMTSPSVCSHFIIFKPKLQEQLTAQTPYDEQTLLAQIAKGDEKAFEHLFRAHHQALGFYIYGITKSRELTEEIVQDCFLKVWIGRETLTEIKSFRTWLFVLSRNAAISAFRKKMAGLRVLENGDVENIPETDSGWVEKEQVLNLLERAVEQLSPRQKEVFEMSRYKHMKHAEIAKQMGLSTLTVKEHMKQALQSIRQYVKDHGTELPLFLIYFFLKK